MSKVLYLAASLLFATSKKAQYPVFRDSVSKAADATRSEAKKKSKEAWIKALEVVKAEEKNGKPFIPWAAKPSDLPQAKIPSFPGAEGGGAYSFGGRGGKVYVVKTLADSGPGSFREACEQGGARIIVFNVAGIIKLKSPVNINAPYITISGRTAPGDGVCIAGESVLINTHDVVISYMRFRRGENDVTRRDDGLGGNPVGNIMIDHVSASWGLDENMSIYRHVYNPPDGSKSLKLATVNISIQNSIFSEGLDTYNHAFGSTIGGYNSSFMRNLCASNVGRNPSVGMDGSFNFVNNVIFNWWNRSIDGGGATSEFNIINNYFKPGPVTLADKPIAYRILKPESSGPKEGPRQFGKAYVAGNFVEGYTKVSTNNWDGGVQIEDNTNSSNILDSIKQTKPFTMAAINMMPAHIAYSYVLENAGATLPKRDAVDARIVRQVKTGKIEYVDAPDAIVKTAFIKRRLPEDSYKQGIITDPKQVGGYPAYKGNPYKDSDNDGMPDSWEIKYGLNPKDATDALKDLNGDGYTNIEKFIFNIDPSKKTDWKTASNNINPYAVKIGKIVNKLDISDTAKTARIWQVLEKQYQNISAIESVRVREVDAANAIAEKNKAKSDSLITSAFSIGKEKLNQLHTSFIKSLNAELTAEQIETVKDVMTDYGMSNEYKKFMALLPTLKEDEKLAIKNYLIEARENAMDALTSREHHQWFAKFRGRANNYLSKLGYNLREATERLEKEQGKHK